MGKFVWAILSEFGFVGFMGLVGLIRKISSIKSKKSSNLTNPNSDKKSTKNQLSQFPSANLPKTHSPTHLLASIFAKHLKFHEICIISDYLALSCEL